MRASVDIAAPVEAVYRFAADPTNDGLWRDEVASISGLRSMSVGGSYTEHARIGAQRDLMTVVRVDAISPPHFVRFSSPPGTTSTFAVECSFAAIGPSRTRFTYQVFADTGLVRDIMPIAVPDALAGSVYQARMSRSQWRLKVLLERGR